MTNKIICYIRGIEIVETPEEKVRQEYVRRLVEEYGYPKELIDVEVPIQLGRDETKKADIVIYHSEKDKEKRENHYIIVECKEPDIKFPDGEKQLKSYINATTAQIGVWTNGTEFKYWKRLKEPDRYEEKGYLPKYGREYGDKKILKKDLRPASNLQSKFDRIHNDIYANYKAGNKTKVFYQVIYLLFAKIQDEKSYNPECEFVIYDREWDEIRDKGTSKAFQKRIFDLFEQAKSRPEFNDIFDGTEKIEIPIRQIANVVSEFENVAILNTDAKGEAFQAFISGQFRGDAGQFFTPDPIKKLIVEMLEPEPDEVVLDPACGSSGFLVFTINHYRDFIKKQRGWIDEKGNPLNDVDLTPDQREILRGQIKEYANSHIKGVDFDNDLTKVAKMYMVMVDDGHTGIWTSNSLIPFDELVRNTRGTITPECADIIMTNPPFGSKGKVQDQNILSEYDFGYAWKKNKKTGKFQKEKLLAGKKGGGQVPDILFIERCLSLLKKGGRMGIVLPDGDLTNQNTEFVRAWLKNKAQIVAVISLPQETFVPFGAGVKSSILFLKKPKGKLPERYPIFFANLQEIGYDIRGRRIYKRNEKGEVIDDEKRVITYLTDRKGNKTKQDPALVEMKGALESDVPEVLEKWRVFKSSGVQKESPNSFWRQSDEIDIIKTLEPNFWQKEKYGDFKGFKTIKFGEIFDCQKGIEVGSAMYKDKGEIPFIRVSDLGDLEIKLGDSSKYINETLFEELKEKYQPRMGELLFSKDATIGLIAKIQKDEKMIISSGIVRLNLKNKNFDIDFLMALLSHPVFNRKFVKMSTGSVIKHLNMQKLLNIEIPIVDKKTQNAISQKMKSFLELREESKQKLQEAKDFVENLVKKP